jgi:glycerophosphoryl diester phosphodiesterase
MVSEDGLDAIAEYADFIAPEKSDVIARQADGRLEAQPTGLVERAHARGLGVVPYTFRRENTFLPADAQDDPIAELVRYLHTGVDGLFTDFPDLGVTARQRSSPVVER